MSDLKQQYLAKKVVELKKICESLGVNKSGNKAQLVDFILAGLAAGKIPIDLDIDQLEVLKALKRGESPIVQAAAGCGKTTLIGAIVEQFGPSSRILILVYNKYAKQIIKNAVEKFGANRYPKLEITNIDAYCYKIQNDEEDPDYEIAVDFTTSAFHESAYSKLIEISQDMEQYDLILIDEAQDIQCPQVAKYLLTLCKQYILLGDPMQNIYGTAWFEEFKPTHILRYNHRSSPQLVEYLNKLSPIQSIATRTDLQNGIIKHYQTPNICDDNMCRKIANLINKSTISPKIYIISPYTISKMGVDIAIKKIQRHLHLLNPGQFMKVDSGENVDINENKKYDLFTAHIKRLKGYECDTAIIIGDFEFGNLRNYLYTCISRAKTSCIVFSKVGDIIEPQLEIAPLIRMPGELAKLERSPIMSNVQRIEDCLHYAYLVRPIIKYKFVELVAPIIIVFDTETCRFGKLYAEIGALAFAKHDNSYKLVDKFKILADGIEEIELPQYEGSGFNFTELTGLREKNVSQIVKSQTSMIAKFNEFIAKFDNPKFGVWAGTDRKLIANNDAIIDGHAVYLQWLKLNNIDRIAGTSLEAAKLAFMGPDFEFAAHRATEDALMTFCIILLMTNI